MRKLKQVKAVLKTWYIAKEELSKKAERLEKRLQVIEEMGDEGRVQDSLLDELKTSKLELWECLRIQDDEWRKKARMGWMKNGDLNTKLFHRIVKGNKESDLEGKCGT
ncbi:hypothetical protein V6N13_103321 [Hibiscus sabdariffa]